MDTRSGAVERAKAAEYQLTETIFEQCRFLRQASSDAVAAVSLYLPLDAGAPVESLRIACVRIAEEHDLAVELTEQPASLTFRLTRRPTTR